MRKGRPKVLGTLTRSLRLRCPACGRSSIFKAPFRVRHHCPSCSALFQREAGFFVGAIMVNMVVTETAALAFYFAALQMVGFSEGLIFTVALPLAFALPVLFYHHSWSLWLGFDHLVEGLPKDDGRGPAAGRG
jgi:uncharacterized protein (DUF983 family)